LRSLEEFRKNPCVKIPPKSPCTNFQNPCKFKKLIFILKGISFSFWPSQPNCLTGQLGLLAHSAHRASSSSFITEAGERRHRQPFAASPRRAALARHGATAPSTASHTAPISLPPPSIRRVKCQLRASHFIPINAAIESFFQDFQDQAFEESQLFFADQQDKLP
jgi:hypothetical protein